MTMQIQVRMDEKCTMTCIKFAAAKDLFLERQKHEQRYMHFRILKNEMDIGKDCQCKNILLSRKELRKEGVQSCALYENGNTVAYSFSRFLKPQYSTLKSSSLNEHRGCP